ncbi:MAG: RT0821/Lpp0805 family surface protein [Alphaproteobacteria bacterium]|nr:RT0821/Lpp0805 family surface protein [Alphaproteobacteria bacterium]
MKQVIAVAAAVFLLAACGPDQGPKQTLGTIIGGVGGAVLGNEVGKGRGRKVAIAAGTLLGAMLGSRLGRDLDEADRITAEQTTQGALERGRVGSRTEWENPDSGNSGWVVPTRTWQEDSGQYCREFQTGIIVGGEEQTAYGTACRQPDGSWKIVQPAA